MWLLENEKLSFLLKLFPLESKKQKVNNLNNDLQNTQAFHREKEEVLEYIAMLMNDIRFSKFDSEWDNLYLQ
jgi:hypothetical protein